jgi:lipoate-protein ligase B
MAIVDSYEAFSVAEKQEIQKKTLEERVQGSCEDTLIIVEHPPVYTVGRAMSKTTPLPAAVHVPELGPVPVVAVDRGGKMTYHGPGQIVAYPIFHLAHKDVRRFLKDLEKVMAAAVLAVGLPGRPTPETLELEPGQLETGLWVGDHKVGSIGVHIKHWVSYHGIALNVHPDMRYFQAIEPCGFKGDVLSSVLLEKGLAPDAGPALYDEVKAHIVSGFTELAAYYAEVRNRAPSVSAE